MKREYYLDVLKALSILLVVIIHVSANGLSELEVSSSDWMVCNIFDSISRCAVPIFVMISGAIFLHPDKKVNLKKSLTHLIIPLVFWTIFFAIFATVGKYRSINAESISYFIKTLIKPSFTWFLYMIIGCYISIPLLRRIVSEKKVEEYFLLVWLGYYVILPWGYRLPFAGHYLESILSQFQLPMFVGFTGYFVLGHYINAYGGGGEELVFDNCIYYRHYGNKWYDIYGV